MFILSAVKIIKFIERKQWFIVGSKSGTIYVYNYKPEVQKITSFRVKKYFLGIDSLAVHPTQPYVLSSCGGYIQLWDWDKNWECIKIFETQSDYTNQLTFNPKDTNSFASASGDHTVQVKVSPLSRNQNFKVMNMHFIFVLYTCCSALAT